MSKTKVFISINIGCLNIRNFPVFLMLYCKLSSLKHKEIKKAKKNDQCLLLIFDFHFFSDISFVKFSAFLKMVKTTFKHQNPVFLSH